MSDLEPYMLYERFVICMNKANIKHREIWIYPSRNGYKVEILPNPDNNQVVEITECLKTELNVEARVENRPYGMIIRISARIH